MSSTWTISERPTYFNLAGNYVPILNECISKQLWIRETRSWWGPYHWALRFGVTYMGGNYVAHTANPYDLIREAEECLKVKSSENRIQRVEEFKAHVDLYYKLDFDKKLLNSIKKGTWVY